MPNPNHLSVICYQLKNLDIGWGNLTHVTLDFGTLDECIDLIQRAPHLECLSLDHCKENDIGWEDQPMIRHGQVRHLYLGYSVVTDLMSFVDLLDLPSLKGLGWRNPSTYP